MKIQGRAYVLHRRPYRDTSLLIDFFTEDHGVISAVCRGARQSKKKVPLESFRPFWIEYSQRNSLASLYQYEPETALLPIMLAGNALYCALYLNELLTKLLGQHDPYMTIFSAYQNALQALSQADMPEKLEIALRTFEFFLLHEIGYGLAYDHIHEDTHYDYEPHRGFIQKNTGIYEGAIILAIAQADFSSSAVRKAAKHIIRQTWDYLLKKQDALKTRSLFSYQDADPVRMNIND